MRAVFLWSLLTVLWLSPLLAAAELGGRGLAASSREDGDAPVSQQTKAPERRPHDLPILNLNSSLRSAADGRNLIIPVADLWTIEQSDGTLIRSSAADEFTVQPESGKTRFVWRFAASNLRVEVTLEPGGSEGREVLARWSARCDKPGGIQATEIHFPILQAADSLQQVTSPGAFRALCNAESKVGGLYPGHSSATIQCLVAWGGGPDGLYIAAHDPDGYTKKILWKNRSIKLTYYQPDPQKAQQEFRIPYPIAIVTFRGDWQDGLDLYRRWTRAEAPWCQRGKLTDYAPKWAKNSTVWIYCATDPPLPVEELFPRMRQVFGIDGAIGVHTLGAEIQDHSNMPEGDPPAWMHALKQRQTAVLKKQDVHVLEYRNCHKHTLNYLGFDKALPHAVTWRGGTHVEGPYGGGTDFRCRCVPFGTPGSRTRGTGADRYGELIESRGYLLVEMCMGTQFWREQILREVRPIPECGLAGVYLDQLGFNPYASRCDNPQHGHPLRGGNWYVKSHEKMLEEIRSYFRSQGLERPLISHEFLSEPMIGLLNAALLDWDVRVLSYVYHPYVLSESHEPYDGFRDLQTLRLRMAQDFHAGRLPALNLPLALPGVKDVTAVLCDKNDPADQPAFGVIRRWLGVRAKWLNYLNLGDMQHDPKLLPGSGEVMTSAWRCPEGRLALFFSNITGQPQKVRIDLKAYGAQQWTVSLNKDAPKAVSAAEAGFEHTLGTDDTLVLEATPAK